jgi:hypothetical protein
MTYQQRAFDWRRALVHGVDLVAQNNPPDAEWHTWQAMWELLREAAETSKIAYAAPPRSGYPAKSLMPDATDDITYWQRMAGYVRGELEDAPTDRPRPPMPSAAAVSRCDAVLYAWHHGTPRVPIKFKRPIYMRACGVPPRKIRAVTGISKDQLQYQREKAMVAMLRFVGVTEK